MGEGGFAVRGIAEQTYTLIFEAKKDVGKLLYDEKGNINKALTPRQRIYLKRVQYKLFSMLFNLPEEYKRPLGRRLKP